MLPVKVQTPLQVRGFDGYAEFLFEQVGGALLRACAGQPGGAKAAEAFRLVDTSGGGDGRVGPEELQVAAVKYGDRNLTTPQQSRFVELVSKKAGISSGSALDFSHFQAVFIPKGPAAVVYQPTQQLLPPPSLEESCMHLHRLGPERIRRLRDRAHRRNPDGHLGLQELARCIKEAAPELTPAE
ncbi:unnamed protein product, partial [Prorocentrum cordatum]